MLLRLAQDAGGALMYGWALWLVGGIVVGALLMARDEARLWWAARRRMAKDRGRTAHDDTNPTERRECERHDATRRADHERPTV